MPSYEKRSNGWTVRFRACKDGLEKQIRLSGFETKRQAELAYLNYDYKNVKKADYEVYLKKYIDAKSVTCKKSTMRNLESHLKLFKKLFKDKDMNTISQYEIFEFISAQPFTNISKTIYAKDLKAMYFFLNKHFNINNVMKEYDLYWKREKKYEFEYWTLEDFKKFISVVDDKQSANTFTFLYFTGVRIGEAVALTWDDIDFEKRTFSINKTFSIITQETTTPKTSSSIRLLKFGQLIYDVLKSQKELSSGRFVFPNITFTYKRSHFKEWVKKAGVPELSYHGFRHSFASLMLSRGVPITVVSKYLGHSNSQTTLETYSHFLKSDESSIPLFIDNLVTNWSQDNNK